MRGAAISTWRYSRTGAYETDHVNTIEKIGAKVACLISVPSLIVCANNRASHGAIYVFT